MDEPLPVCEAWFEAEHVDDDLFRITEPHAGPLISANSWLLLGAEADLLVDTGNGLAPLRPFVDRLRPDTDRPLIALATHAHMDHVGGLHGFDDRLLHPADTGEAAAPHPLLMDRDIWPAARQQMVRSACGTRRPGRCSRATWSTTTCCSTPRRPPT